MYSPSLGPNKARLTVSILLKRDTVEVIDEVVVHVFQAIEWTGLMFIKFECLPGNAVIVDSSYSLYMSSSKLNLPSLLFHVVVAC